MPHNELLYNLRQLGITGPLWMWFKAYLEDRKHFVHLESVSSTLLPVKSGIPQGSLLGPLLSFVYVNDLSEVVSNSSIYIDTKFIKSITSYMKCCLPVSR